MYRKVGETKTGREDEEGGRKKGGGGREDEEGRRRKGGGGREEEEGRRRKVRRCQTMSEKNWQRVELKASHLYNHLTISSPKSPPNSPLNTPNDPIYPRLPPPHADE